MTTPEDVERAKREAVRMVARPKCTVCGECEPVAAYGGWCCAKAVRGDVVTVRWVCLRVLGRTEKRLCMATKQDTHTRYEWDRHRATTRCSACDGVLTQRSDGCELVSDRRDAMQAK